MGDNLGYVVHSVYITSELVDIYYLIYITDNIGKIPNHIENLMKTFEYTDVLMLLGDQFNSTKYQNPTSTGETDSDNANNIWCPILFSIGT